MCARLAAVFCTGALGYLQSRAQERRPAGVATFLCLLPAGELGRTALRAPHLLVGLTSTGSPVD